MSAFAPATPIHSINRNREREERPCAREHTREAPSLDLSRAHTREARARWTCPSFRSSKPCALVFGPATPRTIDTDNKRVVSREKRTYHILYQSTLRYLPPTKSLWRPGLPHTASSIVLLTMAALRCGAGGVLLYCILSLFLFGVLCIQCFVCAGEGSCGEVRRLRSQPFLEPRGRCPHEPDARGAALEPASQVRAAQEYSLLSFVYSV